jgi:hypothetical protein
LRRSRTASRLRVLAAGLELAILAGAGFQSRCVYQFRHASTAAAPRGAAV